MARAGLNDRLKKEKEAVARPIETIIRSKEEIEKENKKKYLQLKKPKHKTFLLDPITIEAIRIYVFEYNVGISKMIVNMLLRYIPREIWAEARANILKEETTVDYWSGLEELDINDIYYYK